MADVFDFDWAVDQHGYVLEEKPPGPLGRLLDLDGADEHAERDGWNTVIRPRGGPLRYHRPMERPALWRRFANITDMENPAAGALEFVTLFGLLNDPRKEAEALGFILETARVLRAIARALDNGFTPIAADLFNRFARPQVTARIAPLQPGERHPDFELAPLTLRSALYLQAGNAITGDLKFRQCPNCSDWFQVGSGAATVRKRFCSDRCRVAWSRKPAEARLAG